ncbi:hypothetical protein N9F08_00825 [bacterium]|nr:hypothetical protein [bacterium]
MKKMPGFNLYSSSSVQKNPTYNFDGLEPVEWIQEDDFKISSQTPINYPKNSSPNPNGYLEGSLYSNSTESNLNNLYHLLDAGRLDESAKMVHNWDGEFVIVYAAKDKIYVVSDAYGRLPVYYSNVDGQYQVTRNISFVRSFQTSNEFDKMQLGVSLLFGFQLGEATLWESIHKAPPHSILEIDRSTNKLKVHRYFKLKTVNGDAHFDDVKEEIRETFVETLKSRLEFMDKPTLSLSGGLDSRLIAAALKHIDAEIPYITYSRDNNVDILDHVSSKEITQRLGAEGNHEMVTLGPPTINSANELLNFKQGFNFLSMSYIVPYYKLHEERGISTITGDGGGKYFVDLYPLKSLKSMDQLINYLLRYNAFCDFDTAANIAGIKVEELKSYVIDHISAYPFDDFNDKYTYFLIREAGINWAFEGEDRNRQYCWSSTPFYNPKLIDLCLSIPQRSKEYGALFKYLYGSFPGGLGTVSNPNWNEVVDNSKSVRRIHNRQKLKSYIPTFVLDYKKGLKLDEFTFSEEFKVLKSTCRKDQIDLSQMKSKHTMNFYWQLYTLMKLSSIN